MRTCAVLVAALVAAPAWGHGGVPAIAELTSAAPCVRVDDAVTLRWTEPDVPSVFGPSVVQLAVARTSTRPLYTDERPLTPWAVVHEVLDSDPADAFVWRTATVAPGHYFVWSHMVEPPMEGLGFAAYQAPYVVTVERPGALEGPTVMLTRPASLASSFGRYELSYAACDPTGTARVRLEAAPETALGAGYVVIADDLPAVERGAFTWDTTGLERTRWVVRARIADDCGHVFESHARAFVEVRDPIDPYDAGTDDARAAEPIDARTGGGAACRGRPDAAGSDAPDAGPGPDAARPDAGPGRPSCPDGSGCEDTTSCAATSVPGPGVIAVLAAMLCIRGLRRRQRG